MTDYRRSIGFCERTVKFEAALPCDANPTVWVSIHEKQVDTLRWMFCPNYNECLTYAASQGWMSFVCIFCKVANGHLKPFIK